MVECFFLNPNWYWYNKECLHKKFTYSALSHYLNQHWLIVNWTLKNKLQWNLNQIQTFHWRKCLLRNGGHFCSGEMSYGCSLFARVVFCYQKYIVKPLERNISLYNLVWGSIKPVWLLQPSLLHRRMSFYCKHVCTNICFSDQIPHPYDVDTCTNKEQYLCLEIFNLETVPYHTLCLYVEYAVLCGNKVLLNLNLKFEIVLVFIQVLCSTYFFPIFRSCGREYFLINMPSSKSEI